MANIPKIGLDFSGPTLPSSLTILTAARGSFMDVYTLSAAFLSVSGTYTVTSLAAPSPAPVLGSSIVMQIGCFTSITLT